MKYEILILVNWCMYGFLGISEHDITQVPQNRWSGVDRASGSCGLTHYQIPNQIRFSNLVLFIIEPVSVVVLQTGCGLKLKETIRIFLLGKFFLILY